MNVEVLEGRVGVLQLLGVLEVAGEAEVLSQRVLLLVVIAERGVRGGVVLFQEVQGAIQFHVDLLALAVRLEQVSGLGPGVFDHVVLCCSLQLVIHLGCRRRRVRFLRLALDALLGHFAAQDGVVGSVALLQVLDLGQLDVIVSFFAHHVQGVANAVKSILFDVVLSFAVVLVTSLDEVQLEERQHALLDVLHPHGCVLAQLDLLDLSFVELSGEGVLESVVLEIVRRVVELVVTQVQLLRVEGLRFKVCNLEVRVIGLGLHDDLASVCHAGQLVSLLRVQHVHRSLVFVHILLAHLEGRGDSGQQQ
uniref:Vitellogenin 2 n=1 Tax=Rhipicephalus appendiculatus TaxID=34631 RepID=A0A131YGX7_RHIAP